MTKENFDVLNLNTGSFDALLNSLQRVPVLSVEEERELFTKYRNNGDEQSLRKIVLSNIRFVVSIAHNYRTYGFPLEDLVQEGVLGMLKAIPNFELEHEVKFISFAVHSIKGAIHQYIISNYRLVKIATTKAQRKAFFNFGKLKTVDKSGWLSRSDAGEMAEKLNISDDDIVEMEGRLASIDVSINGPAVINGEIVEEDDFEFLTYETEDNPEEILANSIELDHQLEKLHAGLEMLDERARDIVESRWLADKKLVLRELSEKYGVSMERIRQIEASAFKKIKEQY